MGRLSLGPLAKTTLISESEGGTAFLGPGAASSRPEPLKQFRYRGVRALTPASLITCELFACLYSSLVRNRFDPSRILSSDKPKGNCRD